MYDENDRSNLEWERCCEYVWCEVNDFRLGLNERPAHSLNLKPMQSYEDELRKRMRCKN